MAKLSCSALAMINNLNCMGFSDFQRMKNWVKMDLNGKQIMQFSSDPAKLQNLSHSKEVNHPEPPPVKGYVNTSWIIGQGWSLNSGPDRVRKQGSA